MSHNSPNTPTAVEYFAAPDAPLLIAGKGLAQWLSISLRTLWRKDSAGLLPRAINLAGSKRWRRGEIVAWIEAGCPDRRTWEAWQAAGRPQGETPIWGAAPAPPRRRPRE